MSGVSNGQYANETTFNDAFMARNGDTDTNGKVGLLNPDSGPTIANTQQFINEIADTLGTSEGDANAKNYASNNYLVDGNSHKESLEKLDEAAQLIQDQVDVLDSRVDQHDLDIADHETRLTSVRNDFDAHVVAADPHPQYETAAEAQAKVDAHANRTDNPHAVTKAQVGLGNADNTSDADKPVSTAQASAIASGDAATLSSANAYTDQKVADLIDSAPAVLDTLNELANALGDDPNFATTVSTALGNRLRVDTDSQGLTGTEKTNAKTNIDLQNVDNTSDMNKPVSTAQAAADSDVQAFAIQRANHTGNQPSSTISDFSEAAQDASAEMITNGTHDGVSVSYDDVNNVMHVSNIDKGTDAVLSHLGEADPHPQYLTPSEGNAAYDSLGSASAVQSNLNDHEADTANPHSTTKAQVGLGNVTDDAQLKREANDFFTFVEKSALVNDDIFLIEDSEDSFAKKKVKKSALGTGGGGGGGGLLRFTINGNYGSVTVPATYVDGFFISSESIIIKQIIMFNQAAGTSGTTELDIKIKPQGSGIWASIFSTTPQILSGAGSDVWVGAGQVIPNTVAPVLSLPLTIPAYTAMRFDIIQKQAGNPTDCGLILVL